MKRAFISVSDKTGVVELARELSGLGYEIVSTGGTAAVLTAAGIPVTGVTEVTGFPECLGGRVKTLHPAIHAGILAMRADEEHMHQLEELNIKPIDIIVVNLYPFRKTISKEGVTFEEAIENIDIGGPSMLRAAAKNYQDVLVLTDSADYGRVLDALKSGEVTPKLRLELALKVFEHTAAYDALIASYLRDKTKTPLPRELTFTFEKVQDLRYGENPHQRGFYYREIGRFPGCLHDAEQLSGKELSYNNISDANGALELLKEFDRPTVVAIKHTNPCGVATRDNIFDAYMAAYEADPVSIFGGIVAANREIDEETAIKMSEIFLEIVLAPSFTPEALEILKKRKNLRVLRLPNISAPAPAYAYDFKKVLGGLLIQDIDSDPINVKLMNVVTKAKPTEEQLRDMVFALRVVKHVKSNAIVVAKDECTVGIGPGQVNRIWAVEQALEHGGKKSEGAVLASDAFFPFDDCVHAAAKHGIKAIVQPGGSIRDEDSIKACDLLGIAMVFSHKRHFKH